MQDGQITPTATILTWIQSTMVLISVIASLVAGCHLCSKHRGNMRKLGIALVLVFIAWLLCSNLLPAAVFYLAGNTRQTAFISMNLISMITTTSTYIYAYYRMFRAIKLNKYKFSDIQIIERLSVLQKEICTTLQISRKSFVYLQRISFLAIKIECKMNSKVNKENMIERKEYMNLLEKWRDKKVIKVF